MSSAPDADSPEPDQPAASLDEREHAPTRRVKRRPGTTPLAGAWSRVPGKARNDGQATGPDETKRDDFAREDVPAPPPRPLPRPRTTRAVLAFGGLALVVAAAVTIGAAGLAKLGHQIFGNGPGTEARTTMVLRASEPDGHLPDRAELERTRAVMLDRLAAFGFGDATITIGGDQSLTVTVPGHHDPELRTLLRPAHMRLRQVLNSVPDRLDNSTTTITSPEPPARTAPPVPPAPPGTTEEERRQRVIDKLGPAYETAQRLDDPNQIPPEQRTTIEQSLAPFASLTPAEVAVLPSEIQFSVPTIHCVPLDARPASSIRDIGVQATACGEDKGVQAKFLLDTSAVTGEDVEDASYDNDPRMGGWFIILIFKTDNTVPGLSGSGQDRWATLAQDVDGGDQRQIAVVLDNRVVSTLPAASAPSTSGVTRDGAEATGTFTEDEARSLTARLRYGALPVTFAVASSQET